MVHSRLAMLLAVIVIAAVTANPGVAFAVDTTRVHHAPLFDCAPAQAPSADSDSAFRANLASALGALPSAAAPKGFATTQSGATGHDRAFTRGLCFNTANRSSSGACFSCLSTAAEDVTSGCNSRRAAVWRAGCFLSYADTNASSAREDAFHGWFYAVDPNTTTATPDRECAPDRSAADCARCFKDAARAAAALGWLQRIRAEDVLVVGYACYLRVQISALPQDVTVRRFSFDFLWMPVIVYIEALILALTFGIIRAELQLQ